MENKISVFWVAIYILTVTIASGQDWQIVRQGTADILPGVCFFLNASTGWIIADEGFVKKTSDGGTTWTTLREADLTGVDWNDAEFVDANVGFACGNSGYIYKTTDGGANWTMIADTANYNLDVVSLACVDANTVYFACDDGLVLKTTNGGTNFAPASAAVLTAEDLNGGIDFIDATHGVVATSVNIGDTWYTSDGGSIWTNVNIAGLFPTGTVSKRLYDVAAGPGNTIVIAGYHSTIFISKDGGQTYSRSGDFSYGYNYAKLARIVDQNTIYIARSIGDLVKTTDGGATWDTLSIGSAQTPYDMSFPTALDGYVFSAYGQWAKTADGGATWTPLNEWPSISLWGIAFPEPDKIVVSAHAGGEITISTDGGDSWTYPDNYATGSLTNLYECEFANANLGFLGGGYGDLRRTTDGGSTWTLIENPMFLNSNKHINSMRIWDANTIFAGGSSGYVMRSTDGGLTWSDTRVGTQTVYDIWAVSATSVIVSAGSGQVHTGEFTEPDIVTSILINDWGSQSMRAVKFRGNIGLVVASTGEVYRASDGSAASLALVYTVSDGDDLYDVDFVDDNLVYAVGEAGTIIKSEDAGATWTELTGPTDATLDKVRYDGETVWAIGNGGTILKLEFSDRPTVAFQVNMSAQIKMGNFISGTDFLDVAGTFNNWMGADFLTDTDGDSVYSVILGIDPGNIEYKFRINGNWDTSESRSNRQYAVHTGDNIIPIVWYDDYNPSPLEGLGISGRVSYCETAIPIANAQIGLTGNTELDTNTDSNGNYQLNEVQDNVTLTASKSDEIDDINGFDLLRLKNILLGVHTATACESWAGDCNGDEGVNGFDLLRLKNYLLGLTVDPPIATWGFDPASYAYSPIEADQSGQDFAGVIFGDVNLNWGSSSSVLAKSTDEGMITFGDYYFDAAGNIHVPITSDRELHLGMLDWSIEFDSTLFVLQSVSSRFLENGDYNCSDGQVNIVWVYTGEEEIIHAEKSICELILQPLREQGIGKLGFVGENYLANGNEEPYDFTYGDTQINLTFLAISEDGALPTETTLYPNYPNPFNPITTISYYLVQPSDVTINIFNLRGELQRSYHYPNQSSGFYQLEWDATDGSGSALPSGIYLYRLYCGDEVYTKRMLLMK